MSMPRPAASSIKHAVSHAAAPPLKSESLPGPLHSSDSLIIARPSEACPHCRTFCAHVNRAAVRDCALMSVAGDPNRTDWSRGHMQSVH